MRTIERSAAFRRDYKRVKASPRQRQDVDRLVAGLVALLAADRDLPPSYRDHDLVGTGSGYRECHLKPDLLLLYRKPSDDTLRLARTSRISQAVTRVGAPKNGQSREQHVTPLPGIVACLQSCFSNYSMRRDASAAKLNR